MFFVYASTAGPPPGGCCVGRSPPFARTGRRFPDLLIPFAALAWALGAPERTARWITAARRSPNRRRNFGFTIAYRQLRDEVGLLDENPLDEATIGEIYQEATDWLASV